VSDHAEMPPSSLEQVIACPASFRLQKGKPDSSNKHSRLGTAAHTLASECLITGDQAAAALGQEIVVEGDTFVVDLDMSDAVQVYLDYVRRHPGELSVEARVTVSYFDTWGTADAIVADYDAGVLRVTDLKFGTGVPVSAQDNAQLMTYALGALEHLAPVADFHTVVVAIVQPRLDSITEATYTVAELMQWADSVVPVLAVARNDPNAPAVPGEKQCRWCRAKAECPALAEMASKVSEITFDPLQPDPGARFAEVLPKLDLIEDWCKAQREAANAHMRAGHPIPGFKLVEGRRGNRAWTDTNAVEKLMRETFRLKHDEMYDRTVIGPKAAEDLLAKASPRRWMKLQPHITQGGGKPSVVPMSDKRPAIAVAQSGEFADLSQEDIA
jgi:hypothetical protein